MASQIYLINIIGNTDSDLISVLSHILKLKIQYKYKSVKTVDLVGNYTYWQCKIMSKYTSVQQSSEKSRAKSILSQSGKCSERMGPGNGTLICFQQQGKINGDHHSWCLENVLLKS